MNRQESSPFHEQNRATVSAPSRRVLEVPRRPVLEKRTFSGMGKSLLLAKTAHRFKNMSIDMQVFSKKKNLQDESNSLELARFLLSTVFSHSAFKLTVSLTDSSTVSQSKYESKVQRK